MDYWKKRKLAKNILIAVLIIAAIWAVRELLRPDATLVTVKYVEDMETFQSASVVGGYNEVVVTRDRKIIDEWIDLLQDVEKGKKLESGGLDQPFPCYIIEYRLGSSAWVAMMQITENRVGRAYQFFGDSVFEFGSDNPHFARAGELMEKTIAAAD